MKSLIGPNSRRPDITVAPSGAITLAARVVHILNLRSGDVLDLVSENSEVFIRVRHRAEAIVGRHVAVARPACPGGSTGSYRAWSSRLAGQLRILAGISRDRILRLPCGDPVQAQDAMLLPIIYKHPL